MTLHGPPADDDAAASVAPVMLVPNLRSCLFTAAAFAATMAVGLAVTRPRAGDLAIYALAVIVLAASEKAGARFRTANIHDEFAQVWRVEGHQRTAIRSSLHALPAVVALLLGSVQHYRTLTVLGTALAFGSVIIEVLHFAKDLRVERRTDARFFRCYTKGQGAAWISGRARPRYVLIPKTQTEEMRRSLADS